jgi:hypothetical protein
MKAGRVIYCHQITVGDCHTSTSYVGPIVVREGPFAYPAYTAHRDEDIQDKPSRQTEGRERASIVSRGVYQ